MRFVVDAVLLALLVLAIVAGALAARHIRRRGGRPVQPASGGASEVLGLAAVGALVGLSAWAVGGVPGAAASLMLWLWFACWTLAGTWTPGVRERRVLRPIGVVLALLSWAVFVVFTLPAG